MIKRNGGSREDHNYLLETDHTSPLNNKKGDRNFSGFVFFFFYFIPGQHKLDMPINAHSEVLASGLVTCKITDSSPQH